MPRKTKSIAVRITENDFTTLQSLKSLIRGTYEAAGLKPPDPLTNAWAIRASLQLHLDALEGRTFAMPIDRFREGACAMMIKFATDALAAHGITVDDVIDHGDTVQFVSAGGECEPVKITEIESPAIPASVAVH